MWASQKICLSRNLNTWTVYFNSSFTNSLQNTYFLLQIKTKVHVTSVDNLTDLPFCGHQIFLNYYSYDHRPIINIGLCFKAYYNNYYCLLHAFILHFPENNHTPI